MNYLLITGGSAGIGASTAQRFSDAGYGVINLSRRDCPVADAIHVPCDLTRHDFAEQIAATVEPLLRDAQRITLVHNAARMDNDTAAATDSAALRDILEINLVAPNTLNQMCLPFMKAGSAIVYVGSTLAEKAVPGAFSYATAKHGMVGMMRATCQDLADTGIHTACVCPGFTDTEMLRSHVPPEAMDSVRAMSVFGRLIDPAEIAETIFWAATNPVINGAVIHANLGQVER